MEEAEEKEEEDETPPDFEDLDIFGVEDVNDIGGGMPLCKEFVGEDWAMLQLRFELCFLVHAFTKDVGEEHAGTGVYSEHVPFFYKKYYKKDLTPKAYGVEDVNGILDLVGDTVQINNMKCLETLIPSELEKFSVFLKLTEEERRRRQLRVASGEEAAKLKLHGPLLNAVSGGGGAAQNNAAFGGKTGGKAGGAQAGGWNKGGAKGAGKGGKTW